MNGKSRFLRFEVHFWQTHRGEKTNLKLYNDAIIIIYLSSKYHQFINHPYKKCIHLLIILSSMMWIKITKMIQYIILQYITVYNPYWSIFVAANVHPSPVQSRDALLHPPPVWQSPGEPRRLRLSPAGPGLPLAQPTAVDTAEGRRRPGAKGRARTRWGIQGIQGIQNKEGIKANKGLWLVVKMVVSNSFRMFLGSISWIIVGFWDASCQWENYNII